MERAYKARPDEVVLKGGFVMELRIQTPRTTRDVDLCISGDLATFIDDLARTAAVPGPDWFEFKIFEGKEMKGEQIVHEGQRVNVHAKLGGQDYGDPFGLDISVADAIVVPVEIIDGDHLITFLDIEPVQHRIYPKETHVAEKLHAISYEWPDNRINSRVKDLVDLGLFATRCEFDADPLSRSIEATFEFRDTHEIPGNTPKYPDGWGALYESMANEHGLQWQDVDELQRDVEAFLNPLLNLDVATKSWTPDGGWR